MPLSIVKNNLQKLHVVKKRTKIEKKWVFGGQTTPSPCPYECSGEIICIGKNVPYSHTIYHLVACMVPLRLMGGGSL
jgi:hypothetical protein